LPRVSHQYGISEVTFYIRKKYSGLGFERVARTMGQVRAADEGLDDEHAGELAFLVVQLFAHMSAEFWPTTTCIANVTMGLARGIGDRSAMLEDASAPSGVGNSHSAAGHECAVQ
jgi:hypothetical protein